MKRSENIIAKFVQQENTTDSPHLYFNGRVFVPYSDLFKPAIRDCHLRTTDCKAKEVKDDRP